MRPATKGFVVSLALVGACALAFCLWGCGPADRETKSPTKAPASSLSMTVVTADATAWKLRDPQNRTFRPVSATGSMLPLVASNSLVLLERVDGRVAVGDVIVRRDGVMHTVTAVNERGAFIMSGINNDRPDGWFPPGAAEWRLAGTLYASR